MPDLIPATFAEVASTYVSGNTSADAIAAFVILGGIALPTLVLWLCSILSAPEPKSAPGTHVGGSPEYGSPEYDDGMWDFPAYRPDDRRRSVQVSGGCPDPWAVDCPVGHTDDLRCYECGDFYQAQGVGDD